jgi:ATP-binding cassette subfamily B protein/subfamily B ATP-binding cassette protein MsbA
MPADTAGVPRWRAYRRLFRYAAPYRRGWMGIVGGTLLTTALSLLQPWPIKILVDHVLGDEPMPASLARAVALLPGAAAPQGLLAWVAIGGLAIVAASTGLEAVLSLQWTRVGRGMVYRLARDLFAQVQRRSLRTHAIRPVGDAIGRIAVDAWSVHAVVDTLLLAPGHALITMIVMVVVMLRLDAGLTVLALGVAPFMAMAAWLFGRPIRRAAHHRREVESRIQAHVHQTLTGVSVVQAFAGEEHEQRRFQQLASAAIKAHQRSALVGSVYGLGSGLVTTAGTAAVMWFAAMRVLEGRLTLGTALVFLAYLGSLQWQFSIFAAMYTTLQSAGAGVDRVMEVFDQRDEVPERPGAPPLPPVRGDVAMEDVSFGYQSGRPVLRGVSLAAAAGDVVAVVGSTGAGKSTLASLICRFADPDHGRVLVDGHDVRDVALRTLRDQVALVLQEPFLLPMSVADNIAVGRDGATRGEIEQAARDANAHAFIAALPDGYDTVVGERGATLSGGERQRIAIARALLKDAPILILDEPTSALDPESERAVVDALERLMRGRTTFIIAHRLSTIRNATSVVVLEHGEVVEQGAPADLLQRDGRFRRLHRLQFPERTGSAA